MINAVVYAPRQSAFVTASAAEGSVKMWDTTSRNEIYDFTVEGDHPQHLTMHTSEPLLRVAYKSGFLRVFNLESKLLLWESMIFESSIISLTFSP